VAEKGSNPNIYIYSYPSMKLYRILRKGTERSYSNIAFSTSGQQFASVGSYPDYLLCVWDWKQECI
jgi:WD40 repeat protein